MFVLTKFFGSKSFRDDFVIGDLYLSSLSRFNRAGLTPMLGT